MADLHVDFLGKRLAGPVVAASGTFGFGPRSEEHTSELQSQ